jgi:hypothetical protein
LFCSHEAPAPAVNTLERLGNLYPVSAALLLGTRQPQAKP